MQTTAEVWSLPGLDNLADRSPMTMESRIFSSVYPLFSERFLMITSVVCRPPTPPPPINSCLRVPPSRQRRMLNIMRTLHHECSSMVPQSNLVQSCMWWLFLWWRCLLLLCSLSSEWTWGRMMLTGYVSLSPLGKGSSDPTSRSGCNL